MVSLIKKGRKKAGENGAAAQVANGERPAAVSLKSMESAEAPAPTTEMAPVERRNEYDAPAPARYDTAATYVPPTGAEDFQLPDRYVPAEPPPSREPGAPSGGLLSRVLLFSGEQTPQERDRVAAEEFEQAIAPVMEYMRAAVPEASTPEEAARILSENQGEITPDPQGGSYVHGDAFDRDARVYYRLLRRDYEKTPRPSEKRSISHHLHGVYNKLPGTRGW